MLNRVGSMRQRATKQTRGMTCWKRLLVHQRFQKVLNTDAQTEEGARAWRRRRLGSKAMAQPAEWLRTDLGQRCRVGVPRTKFFHADASALPLSFPSMP